MKKPGVEMSAKILVVDDNAQVRTLLKDLLTMWGYAVLVAEDGAKGVSVAIEQMPDLILMDVQMPVMNGFDAIAALRKDSRTCGIRILLLTAQAMEETMITPDAAGFDGYLEKPFNIHALPEVIRENLPGKECE